MNDIELRCFILNSSNETIKEEFRTEKEAGEYFLRYKTQLKSIFGDEE